MIISAYNMATVTGDLYWNYVTLLLKDIGINGATNNSFYDDGPYKFLPTRNGDVTQGTFSPFSGTVGDAPPQIGGSVYIPATAGSYLSLPANDSAFSFGTGDFTIEGWFWRNDTANLRTLFNIGYYSSSQCVLFRSDYFQIGSYTTNLNSYLPSNQWLHVAVTRQGTTYRVFVNGVIVNSGSNSTNISATGSGETMVTIGTSIHSPNSEYLNGNVSNFRVVKGTALYTAAFTPPTTPLTAVSGTTVLTCQLATTITDASTNNFTVTRYGDARAVSDSPFGYGSVYFDGSGDYLSLPSSTAVAYGTGDFTVEFWAYPTSTAGSLFVSGYNGTAIAGVNVGITNSTSLWWLFGNGSGWDFERRPTYTLSMNTWHHFAVTRESGTAKLYVDGALVDSVANSTNFGSSAWYVGASASAGYNITGYVSNLRAVKGSAVYTGSSFAVPTAPLTAIAGTSLLTCQDKGRIADASSNSFAVTRAGDAKPVGMTPFAQKAAGYWSNYFDGSGDYLTYTKTSATDFGTGDFTVEFWFNSALTSRGDICGQYVGDYAGSWGIGLNITGTRTIDFYNGNGIKISAAAGSWTSGAWNHAALVRSGSTLKFYVNGTSAGTTSSYSETVAGTSNSNFFIGAGGGAGASMTGYISNLRIVKGTAVYTSAFTPSTAPLAAISGTVLLTCQGNRFRDNSSNNFTLTRNGDTSVSRFNPFGSAGVVATTNLASAGSVYFDGSGDYLTLPDSTAFAFGTGDFSIEMFVAPASSGTMMLYDGRPTSTNGTQPIFFLSGGQLIFQWSPGQNIASTSTVPVGKWSHVALTRSGSTVRIFLDGVQVATTTNTTSLTNGTNRPMIGGDGASNSGNYSGYISNVRVVKGSAVYTGDFTPPTSPLTAISGTSLLTAQDAATITDASSNAFTVTKVGDAKASEASPFKRVSTVYGGSAYFDGTGDYLVASSPAGQLGSGDFTVEAWVYPISKTTAYTCIFNNYSSYTTGGFGLFAGHNSAGSVYSLSWNGAFPVMNSTSSIRYGAWTHLAVVRRNGIVSLYVNGVSEGGTYNSTATLNGAGTAGGSAWIGTAGDTIGSAEFNGYISGFRLVKGVAVYTANFTPPVAPVDAVGGTSLLLNFDNAGIYDGSNNGDMQTVGDTKTSTSVVKFSPGASTAFDGNGDYLSIRKTDAYDFGSGDFTIESWVYLSSYSVYAATIASTWASSSSGWWIRHRDGEFQFGYGDPILIYSGMNINYNTWNHIAVSRNGNTIKMFTNGTLTGSATYSSAINSTGSVMLIGSYSTATNFWWNGSIQDFRITKGIGRYTSAFTPPTLEAATRKA